MREQGVNSTVRRPELHPRVASARGASSATESVSIRCEPNQLSSCVAAGRAAGARWRQRRTCHTGKVCRMGAGARLWKGGARVLEAVRRTSERSSARASGPIEEPRGRLASARRVAGSKLRMPSRSCEQRCEDTA